MSLDTNPPLTLNKNIPLKIALIYLLVGGTWILFSDRILACFIFDTQVLTSIQTFKGWLFVLITAAILYILIIRDMTTINQTQRALMDSYAALETTFEQLTAAEEELKQQFDELLKSDQLLRTREEQYRMLFESNPQPMWIYDCTTLKFLAINEATITYYGYSRREFMSMTINDIFHPEDRHSLFEHHCVPGNVLTDTIERHIGKPGNTLYVETKTHALVFENKAAFFVQAKDVTAHQLAEAKLQHLVYHDPLTNMPNRLLLFDRLTQAVSHALRSNNQLAIIFIDINRFKYVNEAMGHACGDQLLVDFARRLEKIGTPDTTIARIGDDEFVILLPVIDHVEDAARIADSVLEQLLLPFKLNLQETYITASIGIAVFPTDGQDADALLKNADAAMHMAKELGGNNRLFYSPSINRDIFERINLENMLRHALERNEFELYYQPQIDSQTGIIKGVEALLRWHHPQRGLITPYEFIKITEETGLILPLGEWVLRTACLQNKNWQLAGVPPIVVAVNLSAVQFEQANIVELVSTILAETQLSPQFLNLELTESTAIKDIDFTIKTLTQLRAMGVQISLDDFGTGYSSLNYLRRLPINTLKIDRSFITDIVDNHVNASIVKTIILLAENLSLTTVAEGVETKQQRDFFIQHQCTVLQGYLFAKPMPAKNVTELLTGNVQ